MSKFVKHNARELFGPTPVANVSDAEIWAHLISPQVKSFLGKITGVALSKVLETEQGLFPGDEASNLNNHLLYGKHGFVRYPYLATLYRTEYGALVIKRDSVKFKVTGWVGEVEKGRGEFIFKVAMRDRRYDGTLRANDSAVLDYPYDDANFNLPLHEELSSIELSLYAFEPGSRISQIDGDTEFESFVANPFTFLSKPERYLQLFNRVWKGQRAPGMIGQPFPDVARFVAPRFDKIAIRHGYDLIEDAASHYHVAMYAYSAGFRCNYQDQQGQLSALSEGIKRIKEKGIKLTRPQESWVCALQSLRPLELIPAELYMGGPEWMQNNIDQKNLWLYKPLSEKAKAALTGPVVR